MKHSPFLHPAIVFTAMLFSSGIASAVKTQKAATSKPLMQDFMGLCVHTVQFKPELYKPVCRLVRDYHGLNWDVGKDTDFRVQFPFARNRVNWETMYGSWKEAGFQIDACISFSGIEAAAWVNMPRDANTYGFAFARFFGPGGRNLVEAIEIGNEPGGYDDTAYRTVFENMARGIRAGDQKMKIATCALTAGESEKYAKSANCVAGLEELYDVINFHSYAQVEGWPTWRRSYPEDADIQFLKKARDIIAWRDKNAPGKEIWLTEFGWDASTKKAPQTGTFKDWVGSSETQQARYLVRTFLVLSAMDIDRAYIFWFNDDDKPQVHGSSGLTRNYKPKPSYQAVSHLFKTLRDYRFNRIVKQDAGDLYAYEYVHQGNEKERVWAVWSPTGSGRKVGKTIVTGANPYRAEHMSLAAGDPQEAMWVCNEAGVIGLDIGESLVYLWLKMQ